MRMSRTGEISERKRRGGRGEREGGEEGRAVGRGWSS